jgi:hypothetical protein
MGLVLVRRIGSKFHLPPLFDSCFMFVRLFCVCCIRASTRLRATRFRCEPWENILKLLARTVRHWGISLAPAWKTEVHSDRVNFRVSRRQVTVSFASMVAAQASHCRYHIVYGGVRRLLVGFPDVCDVFDLLALTLLVLMSHSA